MVLTTSLSIMASLAAVHAQIDTRTFTLLETVRDNITFIPYTPEQRLDVAKGLQNMFSIYVHREKKVMDYDAEYRIFSGCKTIDPVPRVADMVTKASSMTDKEFHYAFIDIFASLRDLHTNYLLPAPHACYGFIQAVDFTVVAVKARRNNSTKQELVVQSFSPQPELAQLSYPEVAKMNIGDIVKKINGMTFEEFVESVKWTTGGNDESGAIRGAITHLSARPGILMKIPSDNHVTYEMQSYNNPSKQYTVTLPWIASRNDACIQKYNNFQAILNGGPEIPTRFKDRFTAPAIHVDRPSKIEIKRRLKKNLNSMKNIQLETYKEYFPSNAAASKVTFNPTADPILAWAIYAPESKNMGILSISSFMPSNNDDRAIVNLVRSLLLKELKDTNSIVLDMRDNGGGLISMADLLPQLFATKPVKPSYARALVAPANDFIFENSTGSEDEWYMATQRAPEGSLYSPLIQFTTEKAANQLGAVYFKPVGYFHNGNCFSACDLMGANTQDNDVMTIFGEDIRSGAGGANVIEYGDFLSVVNPSAFPKMPYSEYPDSTPINARVSWRQSVRVNKNAGKLIENDGILADYTLVRPSVADLVPGTVSSTQYDFIADKLKEIGRKTGKGKLYFQALPSVGFDSYLGTSVAFNLDLAGISKVLIYSEGVLLGEPLVLNTNRRQQRQIRFDPAITVAGYKSFELRALDKEGNRLFSTIRRVRFLPNPANYFRIQPDTTSTLDLVNGAEIAQFNFDTDDSLGFVANGTALQIGNGQQYTNNVDSRRSFYLKASAPFKVSIDMDYQTEPGFDYFYFGYTDQTRKVTLFLSGPGTSDAAPVPAVSGKGSFNSTQTFQVYATGVVELFVRFTSDGGVTDKGILIRSITIQA